MHSKKKITIAIDGHSSCGKSTLAKDLAKKLNYIYVDSGAMYRGIALYCTQNNLILDGNPNEALIEQSLPTISLSFQQNLKSGNQELLLNGQNIESEIRKPEIAAIVSLIAAIPSVRKKLVHIQRELGKNGGIVMDGRDIGSVVFPHAEVKFFVTADANIRAQRRFLEMKEQGIHSTLSEIEQNLIERDHLDSTREDSPLKQTEDAILINNSHLNRDEQLNLALEIIQKKTSESELIA